MARALMMKNLRDGGGAWHVSWSKRPELGGTLQRIERHAGQPQRVDNQPSHFSDQAPFRFVGPFIHFIANGEDRSTAGAALQGKRFALRLQWQRRMIMGADSW
jgi:hypothetical protein